MMGTVETVQPGAGLKIRVRAIDEEILFSSSASGEPMLTARKCTDCRIIFCLVFGDDTERGAMARAFVGRPRLDVIARSAAVGQSAPDWRMGDVLVSSWGYEQTNVDFYQVTRLVGRTMLEVRQLAKAAGSTGNRQSFRGHALPLCGQFRGEVIRRRVGEVIRLDDYRRATLWDGQPVAWTSYA